MSLPPKLEALRDEALQTSCLDWAEKQGWALKKQSPNYYAGPCPVCGGDDRFYINTAKDAWACRHCGVGGGVIFLVMHVEQIKFTPACERITGRLAAEYVDPVEAEALRAAAARKKAEAEAAAAEFREKARGWAHDIWKKAGQAEAHDPLVLYLKLRGISLEALRHPDIAAAGGVRNLRQILYHPYSVEIVGERGRKERTIVHRGPAMVACIQQADGRFGAAHQTWIDLGQPKGKVKLRHPKRIDKKTGEPELLPAKKVLGVKRGGAIRLVTPPGARRMVMGEGLETTLTPLAHAFEEGTAYWCGVDLDNMAGRALRRDGKPVWDQPDMADLDCFLPPDWVEELVYLVDETDEPEKHILEKVHCGLRRARRLRELARHDNPDLKPLAIFAATSGELGKDFNDLAMVETDIDEGADDGTIQEG